MKFDDIKELKDILSVIDSTDEEKDEEVESIKNFLFKVKDVKNAQEELDMENSEYGLMYDNYPKSTENEQDEMEFYKKSLDDIVDEGIHCPNKMWKKKTKDGSEGLSRFKYCCDLPLELKDLYAIMRDYPRRKHWSDRDHSRVLLGIIHYLHLKEEGEEEENKKVEEKIGEENVKVEEANKEESRSPLDNDDMIIPSHTIEYFVKKAIWPVADREFLTINAEIIEYNDGTFSFHEFDNFKKDQLKYGKVIDFSNIKKFYWLSKSIEEEECKYIESTMNKRVPNKRTDTVRSSICYLAQMLEFVEGTRDKENKWVRYHCCTVTDAKGWIPAWFQDMIITKLPREFEKSQLKAFKHRLENNIPVDDFINYYRIVPSEGEEK